MDAMFSPKVKSRLFVRYKNSYLSYFLMYNFYYLSWALFASLISVYLMGKGCSATQVSLVVSGSFLASMIAQPFIGSLSDRFDPKKVNTVMFTMAVAGGILFMMSQSFWMILISYSFVMVLINGSNPVMEKVATLAPYDYGKIRIWGTIGYALGTQLAGILYDRIAPEAIFIAFVFSMMLCIIGLLGTDADTRSKVKENPTEKNGALKLFTNKKFLYFLVLTFVFAGVTSIGNTYIPTMLTYDGLSAGMASTVLSIAVFCEAPLVLFSGKFMDRLSNKKLLMITFGMILLQYLIYACAMPLPVKIAATFLAKHPAGMLFIMIKLKVVATIIDDVHQITALAIVATVQNLASICCNNLGGILLDMSGYGLMWMLTLGIFAVGCLLLLFYRIPGGTDKKLFG